MRVTGNISRARRAPPKPATTLDRILERSWQIALIGLFAIGIGVVLIEAIYFFAPLAAAIVVALVLGPAATAIERRGLPPALAAGIMLVSVICIAGLLVAALAIPLGEWVERIPEAWEKLRGSLYALREQLEGISEAREDLEDALGGGGAEVTMSDRIESVSGALRLAPAVAGQVLIFVGTFFFFLSTRHELRRSLLSFCMSRAVRCRVARIFRDVETEVSAYLSAITVINICFGLCVGTVLWMMGMPSPLLWGIMATVLNFAPYLGPALMALILFAAGLISFEPVSAAFTASGIFVLLNVIEGQFVTPSIVGRQTTLNPFLVFVTLTFWLWLWGAIGAFLAVPILLIVRTIIVHLLPRAEDAEPRRRARRIALPAGGVAAPAGGGETT